MTIVDSDPQHVEARHRDHYAEPLPFQVFRQTSLYVTIAVVAIVAAVALGAAAVLRDVPLLWLPVTGLVVLAGLAAPGFADGQTPVFVADQFGVRMHIREMWVGLLWSEIGELLVEPGSNVRDGRIRIITKDAKHSYLTPIGFTTSVTARETEMELARLRSAASY